MVSGPLESVLAIELGETVGGAYCGKLLADLGAEVVKVEPPGGDATRRQPVLPGGDDDALFAYNNTGKQSVELDLAANDAAAAVGELLDGATVLLDHRDPGGGVAAGLELDRLREGRAGLVAVSLRPYGRRGPLAECRGGELTITHAGGVGSLLPTRSTDVDRAPVKLGGWQVQHIGGVIAALAALGALYGRRRDGRARLVDVSLQEVVLALVAPLVPGNRYQGTTWSRVPDRPPAMGRLRTRDGYVILNAFDDHHFDAFRDLMGRPSWCVGDEWTSMAYRIHHLMEIGADIDEWMLTQAKDEIHHAAAQRGIPIGPIASAADVMNNPQLAARSFFQPVSRDGSTVRYAGVPYRFEASPVPPPRPAPRLGEHREVPTIATLETAEPESGSGAAADGRLPLAGVRIAEFCWVWAGPYAGVLLAALGADVIKVEGHRRTDLTRRSVVWPLPEPAPRQLGPNEGMAFNAVNLGKRSFAVDLSRPEGAELARSLAVQSDVVVDNMRPGAMEKLGLGHAVLRELRPELVVASSSGRGHVGPERNYLGFASVHQGIGGGAYVTGYPDDHPCHSGGDVDLMNAMTLALAIVAALHHRERTGEGQFIDYSQSEGVAALVGDLLLAYEKTGTVPERMGNRHPTAAPHAVYRAWGVDRWVAVEVHDDATFAALAEVVGHPELAGDARFATAAARKRNEAELDAILAAWTRPRDRDWTVRRLLAAGVAAAPVRDGRDLYADRHLRERGAFLEVVHPELGTLELVREPWILDGAPTPLTRAPLLGEHNDELLGELLGLGSDEIARLREDDIIA